MKSDLNYLAAQYHFEEFLTRGEIERVPMFEKEVLELFSKAHSFKLDSLLMGFLAGALIMFVICICKGYIA